VRAARAARGARPPLLRPAAAPPAAPRRRRRLTPTHPRAPPARGARFSPAAINFPRYKIVVQSVVGQQKQQGVRVASRCLWDTDTDNFSTYTFTNDTLWCTVMCFGLWVE